MCVRQLAWLHAVPDKHKHSRAKSLPASDNRHQLPELPWGGYLLDALDGLGYCRSGPVPVGYPELESWARMTGVELTAWEAETLHHLSTAYVGQLTKSRDPRADAPYWPVSEGVDVSAKFKELARRKGNN